MKTFKKRYVVMTIDRQFFEGDKEDIVNQMFAVSRYGKTFNYRAKFGKYNDDSCLGYDNSWSEKELYIELIRDLFKILLKYNCSVYKNC